MLSYKITRGQKFVYAHRGHEYNGNFGLSIVSLNCVQHTSSVVKNKQTGSTSLNLFSIFSNPHRVKIIHANSYIHSPQPFSN